MSPMTTMIAFSATNPRPVAVAIHHLSRAYSFRRIPMPASPGYRLTASATQPGPGVLAVLVHDHQAAAIRAAGGTVVHLVYPGSATQLPAETGDEVLEVFSDQQLREHLDGIVAGRRTAVLAAA